MKTQALVTSLSELTEWERHARKGDRAIIPLQQVHADIRDYLQPVHRPGDPPLAALKAHERDGFMIVTKRHCRLRPKHAEASKIAHTACAATIAASRVRRSHAPTTGTSFAHTTAAAPSSASSIKEEQLAKGREWAEIVKLLSPYQQFDEIAARRHTLKIVTRQSEEKRLAAKQR
jgi:hypothetical protein